MTALADRRFEMRLRNRVVFGVGAIERLPELVAAAGGARAFLVTDPGVVAPASSSRSSTSSAAAGARDDVFGEVEPNPAAATVERGAATLRGFGLEGTVVVAGRRRVGDGRGQGDRAPRRQRPARLGARVRRRRTSHPAARSSPCRRRPAPAPRRTRSASSPTRRSGARTTSATRRCCRSRRSSIPALTVGLPPASTAATGVDALTHSLESLLSRQPEPVRRGDGARRHPDRRRVAAAGGRRRRGPRGAVADAHGLASGRGRPGERDGRRARPRARATRSGRAVGWPTGRPSRSCCPRCSRFYSASRAIASWRSSASRSASRPAPTRRRPRRPPRSARCDGSCASVGQRPRCARLGFDEAALDSRRAGRHRRRRDPQLPAPAVASTRRGRSWRRSRLQGGLMIE